MRWSRRAFALAAAMLGTHAIANQGVRPGRRKKVVVCTMPSGNPNANPKRTGAWARAFAPHGFIEGENLELVFVQAKSVDFRADAVEWQEIARQVVAGAPDVILIHSAWLAFFLPLTNDIPIVFRGMLDPEHHGSIDSARRPGRNVTGAGEPFFELQEKRLELLKELRPQARGVALVWAPGPYDARIEEKLRKSALRLGLEATPLALPNTTSSSVLAERLAAARVQLADFLWSDQYMSPRHFEQLVKLGIASSFAAGSTAVRAGGLLSYASRGTDAIALGLVIRILRGESVATMPMEQPRAFELALNLRTAKALGITVPKSILMRTDEIVQ